ncbi:MAG: nicotinamide riboside transporter PnuC [Bacteroidota bacterium]
MSDIISNLIESAEALHWTEVWAVIFGTVYIILVLRENIWCWFFGILSCSLWAWATYALYDLWIDGLLNIFYVIMGFVGIYQWKFGSKKKEALPITEMTVNQHVTIVLAGILFTFLLGYIFAAFTTAQKTYLDAFTTSFAIFATFMTIQKKLENWIYWIVVDVLYVFMYWSTGAFLFMLLYLVYCGIAIRGYFDWKRLVVEESQS